MQYCITVLWPSLSKYNDTYSEPYLAFYVDFLSFYNLKEYNCVQGT